MLKLCSVSSQSLSAKEKRTHEAQANKGSLQNVKQGQVQTPPSHIFSCGLHLSSLRQLGIPAKSAAPRNLFQLTLNQAAYILGSSKLLSEVVYLFGLEHSLPLCMRALIKNKAKQNKNNPCSAHLFRAGDLLETYCGEEETATPSSPNDNSKAGFQTNWKVMGSPRQQGPKGLLGPASYKVICSLQGLPHPHFSLLPLLYMCCPA